MTLVLGLDTKAIAAFMITSLGWTPDTEATVLATGVRLSFPPGQNVDIPLPMWRQLQRDLAELSVSP
ncbi:MAG: hypothetical protein QG602_2786 [Verrucomicrobiota bacterium]|jgi:hypothetical protein|nr:hypothetical protein [Verrucomicrobiota bacterium]